MDCMTNVVHLCPLVHASKVFSSPVIRDAKQLPGRDIPRRRYNRKEGRSEWKIDTNFLLQNLVKSREGLYKYVRLVDGYPLAVGIERKEVGAVGLMLSLSMPKIHGRRIIGISPRSVRFKTTLHLDCTTLDKEISLRTITQEYYQYNLPRALRYELSKDNPSVRNYEVNMTLRLGPPKLSKAMLEEMLVQLGKIKLKK
jgi:hypothetical protein